MSLAAPKRDPLGDVRRAIDRAAEGTEQRVELDTAARPVLAALLLEGALQRALLLLERDGDRPRLAIAPRRALGPPTIAEVFEEDHRRLDAIAAQICGRARALDVRAAVLTELFAQGLRRHIRVEEVVVFPVYEARVGRPCEVTDAMRREHRAMERWLARLVAAARAFREAVDRASVLEPLLVAERGLAAVLADHNVREERSLFPLIDRTSAAKEREAMVRHVILF